MAPSPLRAAVAALRQRAAMPVSSRTTGPRMDRMLSTSRRRGPNQVCNYNTKRNDLEIEMLKRQAEAATVDMANLKRAVEKIEGQQVKPWFNSTIKGRLLDWPGVFALTLTVGELANKIWG